MSVNDCLNVTIVWSGFCWWLQGHMNQNIMLVARDNRKKLNKDLSKFQLNYLNLMQILVPEILFLNRNLLFLQIVQKIEVLIKYGSWHISEVGNWDWFFCYIWTQWTWGNGNNLRTHQNWRKSVIMRHPNNQLFFKF